MKLHNVRVGKTVQVSNAITFQADERKQVEEAWPGILSVYTIMEPSRSAIFLPKVKP